MKITVLGLTVTSSWGNGHATTFRSLFRALHARGHEIVFLEKDVEWYRSNRDLPEPHYCRVLLYEDWKRHGRGLAIKHGKESDIVIIGSYFPDAVAAAYELLNNTNIPLAFYDIDTPVTIAQLRATGHTEYLQAGLIPHYAAYLSFTSGPVLKEIEQRFGSPYAVPFYCSVDSSQHFRTATRPEFKCELSYLGTYAPDRQPKLEQLLIKPALRLRDKSFLVAGPMYPPEFQWASNIHRIIHVPPRDHASLYSSSRFTLNLTRNDMVAAGYSPSVRLFEAAACGAAIISDYWQGIDEFLEPGKEVLIAKTTEDIMTMLSGISDTEISRMGKQARERIISAHTAEHRARELEAIVERIYTKAGVRAPTVSYPETTRMNLAIGAAVRKTQANQVLLAADRPGCRSRWQQQLSQAHDVSLPEHHREYHR
jgi:spore maturation protein CgeB